MRLKTYFSDSIQAAVRIAKIELGDQAVLLGSKDAADEGDSKYEVTFGTAAGQSGSVVAETTATEMPHWKRFVPRELHPDADNAPVEVQEDGGDRSDTDLVLNQDPEWRRLRSGIEELCRIVRSDPSPIVHTTGADEIERTADRLRRDMQWETPFHLPQHRALLAFTGPAGAGKSTAIARLARRFAEGERRRIVVLSVGTSEVGLISPQLVELATTGVELGAVDNPRRLVETVEMLRAEDNEVLIFIDTSAIRNTSAISPTDLGESLEGLHARVYLTMPATNAATLSARVLDRYHPLLPSRVVLTHTEDAVDLDSTLQAIGRRQMMISFLSSDAATPNDFTAATPEAIARLLLGKGPA